MWKQFPYHVFADNSIHWHIIPLGCVPQFDSFVISAGEDVRTTRNIAATANHTLVSLARKSENVLNIFNGELVMFILSRPVTCQDARHFRSVRCQTRTSPSAEAEQRVERELGCLETQVNPSLCPSRLPRKGLANTRSSFTAFSARWYSRSASNGCSTGLRIDMCKWDSETRRIGYL